MTATTLDIALAIIPADISEQDVAIRAQLRAILGPDASITFAETGGELRPCITCDALGCPDCNDLGVDLDARITGVRWFARLEHVWISVEARNGPLALITASAGGPSVCEAVQASQILDALTYAVTQIIRLQNRLVPHWDYTYGVPH